jgi:hypothetical protein
MLLDFIFFRWKVNVRGDLTVCLALIRVRGLPGARASLSLCPAFVSGNLQSDRRSSAASSSKRPVTLVQPASDHEPSLCVMCNDGKEGEFVLLKFKTIDITDVPTFMVDNGKQWDNDSETLGRSYIWFRYFLRGFGIRKS